MLSNTNIYKRIVAILMVVSLVFSGSTIVYATQESGSQIGNSSESINSESTSFEDATSESNDAEETSTSVEEDVVIDDKDSSDGVAQDSLLDEGDDKVINENQLEAEQEDPDSVVVVNDCEYKFPNYSLISNLDGTVTLTDKNGAKYIVYRGVQINLDGEPITSLKTKCGDVDADGDVDYDDVTALKNLIDTIKVGEFSMTYDFNGDSVVDLKDVGLLNLHVSDPAKYPIKYLSYTSYSVSGDAKISNCGFNENGKTFNGKAGDQTANEYRIQNWVSKNWICVFRYEGERADEVRSEIASLAIAAAKNDKIGYDQGTRTTFWSALTRYNYNPANISSYVEADCSASTAAIVKATGYVLGIESLKNVDENMTTESETSILSAAGFSVLTDKSLLNSSKYLKAGDILLKNNHTCIVVSDGEGLKIEELTPSKPVTIDKIYKNVAESVSGGITSDSARALQVALNNLGYTNENGEKIPEDGEFNNDSEYALKSFQNDYGLSEDGTAAKVGDTWLEILRILMRPVIDAKSSQTDSGNSYSRAIREAKWKMNQ